MKGKVSAFPFSVYSVNRFRKQEKSECIPEKVAFLKKRFDNPFLNWACLLVEKVVGKLKKQLL